MNLNCVGCRKPFINIKHSAYCAYCKLYMIHDAEVFDAIRKETQAITIEDVAEFCYQLELHNKNIETKKANKNEKT